MVTWSFLGVSKNRGKTPQIIHFNRVFHYFHHPFWSTAIFGNTHVTSGKRSHSWLKNVGTFFSWKVTSAQSGPPIFQPAMLDYRSVVFLAKPVAQNSINRNFKKEAKQNTFMKNSRQTFTAWYMQSTIFRRFFYTSDIHHALTSAAQNLKETTSRREDKDIIALAKGGTQNCRVKHHHKKKLIKSAMKVVETVTFENWVGT